MKKNFRRGFVLAETVAVSMIVIGALTFIYVQFASITKSYSISFKYDNVDKLYAVNNIKSYLSKENLSTINELVNNNGYVDITECPVDYFINSSYCDILFNKLDIKNVLIITKDINLLKNTPILDNNSSKYSQQFKNYVNYIKNQNDCNRIVVEFNDDTYANLNVCEGNI